MITGLVVIVPVVVINSNRFTPHTMTVLVECTAVCGWLCRTPDYDQFICLKDHQVVAERCPPLMSLQPNTERFVSLLHIYTAGLQSH